MDADKGRGKEDKRSTVWGGTKKEKNTRPKDGESTNQVSKHSFLRIASCYLLPSIDAFIMIEYGLLADLHTEIICIQKMCYIYF